MAMLQAKALATITDQDIEEIMQALMKKAKQGCVASAKLVLSYVLGRLQKSLDPDRMDRHNWQTRQVNSICPIQTFTASDRVP